MASDLLYFLYRACTQALSPSAPLFLKWRARHWPATEKVRISERMGVSHVHRPVGRLVWLHGASVGEGVSLLPLIDALKLRGMQVLVTTGTELAAQVLQKRLPASVPHQFFPLDCPKFVTRFLDHWDPDLIVFAESELWPNFIAEIEERRIPFILANARFSDRSFRRWRFGSSLLRHMLQAVDLCLAQTQADAERFVHYGIVHTEVVGNLKFDVAPLPVDSALFKKLQKEIGKRPVWLAASTHKGEEALIPAIHRALAARVPGILTLLAPRHAHRGEAMAHMLAKASLTFARHSQKDPLTPETDIYIVDKMGEMGTFYCLAQIAFIGKSLVEKGGHNPIEPAKLRVPFIYGPYIQNFQEIYAAFQAAGGARSVANVEELVQTLASLLSSPDALRHMQKSAYETALGMSGATQRIIRALEPYCLQLQVKVE